MLLFAGASMFVVLPAVGLSVDLGIAYAAKARLQSSTDGAVMAATRALGRGMNEASRQTEARETATRFFQANLGSGWLGLRSGNIDVTFPASAPKTTTVKIDTTALLPTYFMRVLGKTDMVIHSVSAASRRDVNIMLVIDRSGSLEQSGSCGALREAVKSFVVNFQEGRDKVGMVTYGTTYRVVHDLSTNFRTGSTSLVDQADAINCDGWTNSAAAYSVAYNQLAAANEPGALNAILLFTDGMPNTVTMPRLKVKASSSCTSKGNRFGVISEGGGIYDPVPGTTGSESVPIPDDDGCQFGGGTSLSRLVKDIESLTRSAADGNTGDDTGDEGNITGKNKGNAYGRGGRIWDNWPVDQDAFGNSLFGYKSVNRDGNGRVTLDGNSVRNSGANALANAATRVRTDSVRTGLDVVTYVIGLGNYTGAPELELLNRVANTPASPAHDGSKPVGLMIYADQAGELEAAFSQICSEMLRLSM